MNEKARERRTRVSGGRARRRGRTPTQAPMALLALAAEEVSPPQGHVAVRAQRRMSTWSVMMMQLEYRELSAAAGSNAWMLPLASSSIYPHSPALWGPSCRSNGPGFRL